MPRQHNRYSDRAGYELDDQGIVVRFPPKAWRRLLAQRRGKALVEVYLHSTESLHGVDSDNSFCYGFRARSESGGTRWRTGGEGKEKLANGVGSQYFHATPERGLSSITQADAHTSAASSRLNWRPYRFKWTRPFRGKTKSGFCACAITFRTSYTLSLEYDDENKQKAGER